MNTEIGSFSEVAENLHADASEFASLDSEGRFDNDEFYGHDDGRENDIDPAIEYNPAEDAHLEALYEDRWDLDFYGGE